MIKCFYHYFKDKSKNKKIKKIKDDEKISSGYGLTINGRCVDEFNYLFKFICRQANIEEMILELDNSLIREHNQKLLKAINIELTKDELTEQKNSNISHSTAISNMKNLKEIIETIWSYQEKIEQIR